MTTNELDRLGLRGRTVTGIAVTRDEGGLILHTDGGDVVWGTDADCCSETWFADIIGLNAILGHEVLAVTLIQPEPGTRAADEGRTRQESDTIDGVALITAVGHCEIFWRNSSNGWYGGSIFHVGGEDTPDWYPIWAPSVDDLIEVTEDWSA